MNFPMRSLWLLWMFSVVFQGRAFSSQAKSLVPVPIKILVYDSLLSKGGLAEILKSSFEQECEVSGQRPRVQFVSVGDSGQFVSRLKLESTVAKADAILGVDQIQWLRLVNWIDPNFKWIKFKNKIRPDLWIDERFLPFDFGQYALMVNESKMASVKSVDQKTTFLSVFELLKPQWKRQFILQDPRTSGPGLGFLLQVKEQIPEPEARRKFYRQLKGQWMTVTAGWDEAYGLFLKGIAPAVWSYVSSEAYHQELYLKSRGSSPKKNGESVQPYKAKILDGVGVLQVEGLVLLKQSLGQAPQGALMECFANLLVSEKIQRQIPSRNFMLPAIKTLRPSDFTSYQKLAKPKRTVLPQLTDLELRSLLEEWEQEVQIGK